MKNQYKHIEWIIKNYGQALSESLSEEGYSISISDAMDYLTKADPSKSKGAVDWLVKTYINGGFLFEDAMGGVESKVYETLAWFAQHRKKLSGTSRNLSQYQTLASVYSAIRPFVRVDNSTGKNAEEYSGKSIKRREKEQAFKESILLRREENMIMAVPLTQNASQWWGRGTRWCTASTKSSQFFENNMFNHYNKNSPLIVLVFPKGLGESSSLQENKVKPDSNLSRIRKFQLWVTEKEFQFMNEEDSEVSPEFVKENWSSFEPLISWAWKKNPKAISFYPPELIDQKMVDKALSTKGIKLSEIPAHLIDQNNCNQAFKIDNRNIQWIPLELQTREMFTEIVENYPLLINHVNPDLFDEDLIIRLLEKVEKSRLSSANPFWSIQFGLKSLKDLYEKMQDTLKTEKINNLCSRIYPAIIQVFNPEHINEEMIWRIIKNEPYSMNLIREDMWTQDMVEFVVENNPTRIAEIPKSKFDKQLVLKGLKSHVGGTMISWIPHHLIDLEVFQEIIKKPEFISTFVFNKIPENVWTQEMAELAFKANSRFLSLIPKKFRSNEWKVSEQNGEHENYYDPKQIMRNEFAGIGKGRVLLTGGVKHIQAIGRINRLVGDNAPLPNQNCHQPLEQEKNWNESMLDDLKADKSDPDQETETSFKL